MAISMVWRRGRTLLFMAVAVAALAVSGGARAAEDPCDALAGETIRWIVPFGPGGYDAYSRILAPFLATRLDAEIVVVNMPGAGGVVGAKHLHKARPDGRTLGLLHGSSLLVAELFGNADSPRLPADFTLLGRLTRDSDIWIVADASRFQTVDDLYAKDGEGPVVVGVSSTASKHWLSAIIIGDLLGFEADLVSGYKGAKASLLGLLRGDFEMMGTVASTAIPRIEAGEVRPLLKIGQSTAGRHARFDDVPRLEGLDGLAVRRARALGRDPELARSRASALAGTIAAGRIIAAPPGMDPGLAACLEGRLFETMTDTTLNAAMVKAGRPLDIASGTKAAALIRQAKRDAASIAPIIRERIDKAKK